MSSGDTRSLIRQAVEHLQEEVPALKQVKLVIRLELRARGTDVPIWRVEVPGPQISRDPAGDARIDVSVARLALQRAGDRRPAAPLGRGLRARVT